LATPLLLLFALTAWQSASAASEHEHPIPEKLGSVQFGTSCSADLQPEFERAVALLHSFAYSAAEKGFRDLIAKDPNCAMAHWGLAMSYFYQLWEPYVAETDLPHGHAELDRAKRLRASERERALINALDIIFASADSVPYAERAQRRRWANSLNATPAMSSVRSFTRWH
jgi:hypothetical protein